MTYLWDLWFLSKQITIEAITVKNCTDNYDIANMQIAFWCAGQINVQSIYLSMADWSLHEYKSKVNERSDKRRNLSQSLFKSLGCIEVWSYSWSYLNHFVLGLINVRMQCHVRTLVSPERTNLALQTLYRSSLNLRHTQFNVSFWRL